MNLTTFCVILAVTALLLAAIRGATNRILNQMAINRQQFDTDLAALVTAVGNLITAVQALPQPGSDDFTAEDQQVQTAAQAVQTELNALNPQPPPQP